MYAVVSVKPSLTPWPLTDTPRPRLLMSGEGGGSGWVSWPSCQATINHGSLYRIELVSSAGDRLSGNLEGEDGHFAPGMANAQWAGK